jgi:hypothetical protein
MVEVTADMSDMTRDLKPIENTPVAPAHAIATIALNMAMKFHNITTVQDGALYQQYKLEGKNMVPLQLDMVFETAVQIEAHLLGASDRIAKLIMDAVIVAEDEPEQAQPE